jgi:hypothetical protein
LESTTSTLRSRIKSIALDRDSLIAQVKVLEEERQKSQLNQSAINKTLNNLKESLSSAKVTISAQDSRLSTMIARDEHERIVGELSDQLQEAVAENIEAAHIRDAAEIDTSKLRESNRELEKRITEEKSKLCAAKQQIEDLSVNLRSEEHKRQNLESDIAIIKRVSRQEIESLESSHAVAISLLEQSASSALSKASVTSSALDFTKTKLIEAQEENESLKKHLFSATVKPMVNSVYTETGNSSTSTLTQTVYIQNPSVSIQADPVSILEPSVKVIINSICSCCHCKEPRTQFSLFPCGHGLCLSCCEQLVVNDEISLGGITCPECADGQPITRIIRNRPLESLAQLFH